MTAKPPSTFTLAEISGAISRLLDIPPNTEAIGRLAGRLEHSINNLSTFRKEGLNGAGFLVLVMTNLPQDVADMMNPAKREELMRRKAAHENIYSAEFAKAVTGLAAFGARLDRAVSSTERNKALAVNSDKSAISSADYAKLASVYGSETVATAAAQANVLGMPGTRENIALLARHQNVAAAVTAGDMDKAWDLYNAEQDPQKKKEILAIIQAGIDAQRKQLDQATKNMPPEEAKRLKEVSEAYRRDPKNAENKRAYTELQERYAGNKEVTKALRIGANADKLADAKAQQQGKNDAKAETNVVKSEVKQTNVAAVKDGLDALNDDVSPSTSAAPPGKRAQQSAPRPAG
jgi:hypothetical protein